jgi:hypothetical protein
VFEGPAAKFLPVVDASVIPPAPAAVAAIVAAPKLPVPNNPNASTSRLLGVQGGISSGPLAFLCCLNKNNNPAALIKNNIPVDIAIEIRITAAIGK